MKRRRDALTVFYLQIGCNFLSVLVGAAYVFVRLHEGDRAEVDVGKLAVLWAAIAAPATGLFSVPMVLREFGPVRMALRDSSALDPLARRVARSHAAELPIRMLIWTSIAWLVGIVGFVPFVYALVSPRPERSQVVQVLWLSTVCGVFASFHFYYAIERWVRTDVMPRLGNVDGALLRLLPVMRPRIWIKLMMLVLSTCVLPILTLVFVQDRGYWSGLLMLGSFLLFASIQVYAIVQSVAEPVGTLLGEMKRVSNGDLGARMDPVSLDEIGEMAESFNEMVGSLRRAEFVKETFGRYVSPAVADEILRGGVALGGEKREVTVLFSDIRDFTAMSESMAPEEVVRFLNRYFDRMVGVLIAHGATVDKFVGDAIMATFGVPIAAGDDPRRAVRAGLAMLAELESFNTERATEGLKPIAIGIGIHTGEVIAGNVGSAKKLEYTVIGDTVNTASRIESATKTVGAALLVSDSTWSRVQDEFEAQPTAPVEVKGKREPLQLWKVSRRTRVSVAGKVVAHG